MSKISVIYFSNTGNTEAMAKILAKGIEEGGKEAVLTEAYGSGQGKCKRACK